MAPRSGVVPARAGVIPDIATALVVNASRPRASGGHPVNSATSVTLSASSPRERGSSYIREQIDRALTVVPARAGVIPRQRLRHGTRPRRPRASGGHPIGPVSTPLDQASSPRERGSSRPGVRSVHGAAVVPARAGVIPSSTSSSPPPTCRPRASGGHPSPSVASSTSPPSSPRERGSSVADRAQQPAQGVVPARAGVIRPPSWRPRRPLGRPRASGGHPVPGENLTIPAWSSPRERGSSSGRPSLPRSDHVVPARAGVIPRHTATRGW